MAEKGRRWSPYVYGFDNGIRFTDPDGMWPDWLDHAIASAKEYLNGKPSEATQRGTQAAMAGAFGAQTGAPPTRGSALLRLIGAASVHLSASVPGSTKMPASVGQNAHVETPEVPTTKTAATAPADNVTLYRGVNQNHPGAANAADGVAVPRGGSATPEEHNAGNTRSNYTSWTTNPDVATNFALRPNGSGVVMEITAPRSSTVVSPSLKDVYLKQSPGVKVNESEVLMPGTVTGATTTTVHP